MSKHKHPTQSPQKGPADISAGDIRLMTTSNDGLDIIVNLLNLRFNSLEGSVSEIKASVATLEARPSITPEQHAWIAEGAKRDADAAEQRAQLETARKINRRGGILATIGVSFAAFGTLMNFGATAVAAIQHAFGAH